MKVIFCKKDALEEPIRKNVEFEGTTSIRKVLVGRLGSELAITSEIPDTPIGSLIKPLDISALNASCPIKQEENQGRWN